MNHFEHAAEDHISVKEITPLTDTPHEATQRNRSNKSKNASEPIDLEIAENAQTVQAPCCSHLSEASTRVCPSTSVPHVQRGHV